MSEMPKRVWLDSELDLYTKDFECVESTIYIREDIVDELVSALKAAHCWTSREIHTQHTAPIIESALSKLEDILEDRNDV